MFYYKILSSFLQILGIYAYSLPLWIGNSNKIQSIFSAAQIFHNQTNAPDQVHSKHKHQRETSTKGLKLSRLIGLYPSQGEPGGEAWGLRSEGGVSETSGVDGNWFSAIRHNVMRLHNREPCSLMLGCFVCECKYCIRYELNKEYLRCVGNFFFSCRVFIFIVILAVVADQWMVYARSSKV